MKKDMFGKKIEVGDYVIYIQSFDSQHLEKAIVIVSNEQCIKIQYLGKSTFSIQEYCKQKGKKSKLTVTEKKIIVINSEDSIEKDLYINSKKIIDKELKEYKKELILTLKRETELLKENKLLQAEVNKIHNRFDILDIR